MTVPLFVEDVDDARITVQYDHGAWSFFVFAGLGFVTLFPAQAPAQKGQPQKLEPIPLVLPQPLFEGTPQNLRVPNLEKPRYKAREPFLAPAGVKNVARRKAVTASEEPVMGELSQLTDGDKESEEGSYVTLGPRKQYVTVALGCAC